MALRSTRGTRGTVDLMIEYRAFDRRGFLLSQQEVSDTDSALAWGIAVAVRGAVLVEGRNGDDWVCFEQYRGKHPVPQRTDASVA